MIGAQEAPAMAGRVFDTLADSYDESFTRSSIGRAQRDAVWAEAVKTFPYSMEILELNCGTGEDALFLAGRGHRIVALDVSCQMIELARVRKNQEAPRATVEFRQLATENLACLSELAFDGVYSNFSGLNCVRDLSTVAKALSNLVRDGGPMLLCVSTRVCLWETLWYALHGRFRKSVRRWPGTSKATINGLSIDVYYPSVKQMEVAFGPYFELRRIQGIGVCVPPSYLADTWWSRPTVLRILGRIDKVIHSLPILRIIGDHVVLTFERTGGAKR